MTDLLTTISVIFILAGPFLLLANRYQLPTVPLLIVAGIAAGFFIEDDDLILELAQYGIALLVFTFGVQIQVTTVRTVLADSEIAAVAQILLVGGLGFASGMLLGIPPEESLFVGIAAALSSTIVGTALLEGEIQMNLVRGRLAESIQLVQDLAAIVFVLALGAGTLAADPIATQFGYGVALLLAAVLVNTYLFPVLGDLSKGSDELMIIGVISLLVAFVGAAQAAGISIAVGGFAAGLAVRHDPVEYLGLFNGLTSIRDFFVAIFFVTIGALITLPFVQMAVLASLEKLLIVTVLVLLTAVVKPLVTTVVLIHQGYEARSATLTSLSIDQTSEFALIIAIEAFLLGVLTQDVFDAIILAAAVTMITSSLSKQYDENVYRYLADKGLLRQRHGKIDSQSRVPEELEDHVVIVGHGTTGKPLVDLCESQDRPYVVIENDPERLEALENETDAFVFGDAGEPYTWEKAAVEDARIVISTVDSRTISERILGFDFDADVVLRASDVDDALELFDGSARYVIVTDLLASEQLIEHMDALLTGKLTPEELREERQTALHREGGRSQQL